jgi:hypothetical protein
MEGMMEKLKAHYLKMGPKTFVILCVLLLLVTDLLNSYYLKLWWKTKNLSANFVHLMAQRSGMSLHEFDHATVQDWMQLIDNAVYFLIIIVIVNNLFFYLFYLRKKLWAQGFVLFYTFTAALFAGTFIFDNAGLGMGWLVYNTLTLFMYIYLYLGVKLLRTETTLVREKKGR